MIQQQSDVMEPMVHQDHEPGHESRLEPKPDWRPRYNGSDRLKGKVALITGGDSGIGRAVAALFAREGADVAIVYLCEHDDAQKTRQIVEQEGRRAIAIAGDIGDKQFCEQAVQQTVDQLGRLDILVNNAGISGSSVGDPDGFEGWQKLMSINAASVFLGTKLAAAAMIPNGRGSIVNISSIMGFVGSADSHPAYAASKGAVRLYTKAAAAKYGPSGIRVNSVHPGYMPPMLNATNAAGRTSKIEATPLRRLGEPIEVAYGVLFLASDEASFVTGTELVIDGGYIAQ
jgi:NAD(P)-dependent dehydrogenase (short-subunit alcohol dehydrogenase family)